MLVRRLEKEGTYFEVPQYFRCWSMFYKVIQEEKVLELDTLCPEHMMVEKGICEFERDYLKPIQEREFEEEYQKHIQALLPYVKG